MDVVGARALCGLCREVVSGEVGVALETVACAVVFGEETSLVPEVPGGVAVDVFGDAPTERVVAVADDLAALGELLETVADVVGEGGTVAAGGEVAVGVEGVAEVGTFLDAVVGVVAVAFGGECGDGWCGGCGEPVEAVVGVAVLAVGVLK